MVIQQIILHLAMRGLQAMQLHHQNRAQNGVVLAEFHPVGTAARQSRHAPPWRHALLQWLLQMLAPVMTPKYQQKMTRINKFQLPLKQILRQPQMQLQQLWI